MPARPKPRSSRIAAVRCRASRHRRRWCSGRFRKNLYGENSKVHAAQPGGFGESDFRPEGLTLTAIRPSFLAPDLRCAIAHRGISRFSDAQTAHRSSMLRIAPGMTTRAPLRRAQMPGFKRQKAGGVRPDFRKTSTGKNSKNSCLRNQVDSAKAIFGVTALRSSRHQTVIPGWCVSTRPQVRNCAPGESRDSPMRNCAS